MKMKHNNEKVISKPALTFRNLSEVDTASKLKTS